MPLTSLTQNMLGASFLSLGGAWFYGMNAVAAAAAAAVLQAAAIFLHRRPLASLTVQDRCLMNLERLSNAPTKTGHVSGGCPTGGCVSICLYIRSKNMPDAATGQRGMAAAIAKLPRFSSVVVESASLEDTYFRTVDVDMSKHVVEYPKIPAASLEAALNDVINADLPRDRPLWQVSESAFQRILHASHATPCTPCSEIPALAHSRRCCCRR